QGNIPLHTIEFLYLNLFKYTLCYTCKIKKKVTSFLTGKTDRFIGRTRYTIVYRVHPMNDFITLTPETLDMIAFISKISISPSDKYTYATNILLLFKIIFLSKIALYESLFIVVFHCLNLEYFTNILKFYFVILFNKHA